MTQNHTTSQPPPPSRSSTGGLSDSASHSQSAGSDHETTSTERLPRSSSDFLEPPSARAASPSNAGGNPHRHTLHHVKPRTPSTEPNRHSADYEPSMKELPARPISRSASPIPGSPKSVGGLHLVGSGASYHEKRKSSKESGHFPNYSTSASTPPPSYLPEQAAPVGGKVQPHYQKHHFGQANAGRKSSDNASIHTTGSVMTGFGHGGRHHEKKWLDSESASVYPASTVVGSERNFRKSVASFTSAYSSGSDEVPFGGRFSRAALTRAMGEDGARHAAEISSIPCAGIRIHHGSLKGLMGWRLVVKAPTSPNPTRPGSSLPIAVVGNFIFDTTSRHSLIAPVILEGLGLRGYAVGEHVWLKVQEQLVDFVVTEEDEASVLSLDFLIAGGLSFFIDRSLDAPVVYVEQNKGLPQNVPQTVTLPRRSTISKIKALFGLSEHGHHSS